MDFLGGLQGIHAGSIASIVVEDWPTYMGLVFYPVIIVLAIHDAPTTILSRPFNPVFTIVGKQRNRVGMLHPPHPVQISKRTGCQL